MTRRDVLKYTALLSGGTLAAPVAMSLLSGCKMEPAISPFVPKFLSTDQYTFIKTICGTILPESKAMPGAVSVGVPQMIDHMVSETFFPKDKEKYLQGLNAMMELWSNKGEQSFLNLGPEEKLQWLQITEQAIKKRAAQPAKAVIEEKKEEVAKTESESAEEKQLTLEEKTALADAIYGQLKQQTIGYYLSTEEINTKYLNYLDVPGKYEPCISLEETGGKAWAI